MRLRRSAFFIGLVAVAAGISACSGGGSRSTGTTTALPVTRVAAVQLAAHLGVGVPRGWAPVDFGDARVWVPSEWYRRFGPLCIPGHGHSSVGAGSENTIVDCDIPQSDATTQDVEIADRTTQPRSSGEQIVHGYRVFNMKSRYSEWALYDIPTLGVSIATRGSLGPRVLATLGPSALAVALDAADNATPQTWRAITEGDLSLHIPANWTVRITNSTCVSGDAQVYVIHPIGVTGCTSGPGPPPIGPPTGTTMSIYQPAASDPFAASQDEQLVATVHHGSTTVSISWVTSATGPNEVLDLHAHRAGSRSTDSLTLELGRNGTVPGGIIGSIRVLPSNTRAASNTRAGS